MIVDVAAGVILGLAIARVLGIVGLWIWLQVAGRLLAGVALSRPVPWWWRILDWIATGRDPLGGVRGR